MISAGVSLADGETERRLDASKSVVAPTHEILSLPKDGSQALAQASRRMTYKTVNGLDLEMYVFEPADKNLSKRRPAVLFIHGGGWITGEPSVHALECLYLARHGMVAATIGYRLLGTPGKTPKHVASSPLDCLADAKAAMRFLKSQADELRIDPDRIAASGSSAGGHLATALATLDGFEDTTADTTISCKPNALVLYYPAFELVAGWKDGGAWCAKTKVDPKKFSPALAVQRNMPPTLIMAGADDPISTRQTNLAFVKQMKMHGADADLYTFAGKKHAYYKRVPEDPYFQSALLLTAMFFQNLGWIDKGTMPPLPNVESEHVSTKN